ncbi:MAG: DNA translocase FtsK [Alkalilacustris sp.]
MATWNDRPRDPLLDSATRMILIRRSLEAAGLALLALAGALVLMLASYAPDDPNWMAATDAPARNLLGRAGAGMASALVIIAGLGAWALPVALAAWGGRLLLHRRGLRALSRASTVPMAVAVASVYAATLVPPAGWGHSFGLGGLFGDTVLGALLTFLPGSTAATLKLLSFGLAAGLVALGLHATGFTRPELRAAGRFLLTGLALAARGAMAMLVAALRRRPGRACAAVSAGVEQEDHGWDDDPRLAPQRARRAHDLPVTHATARDNGRDHEDPLPELVDPGSAPDTPRPAAARIQSRITEAIRKRRRTTPSLVLAPAAPTPPTGLRTEPPLRAAPAQAPAPAAQKRATMPVEEMAVPPEDTLEDDALFDAFDATPPPAAPAPRVAAAAARPAPPSRRARAEAQPALALDDADSAHELPPLSLLMNPETITRHPLSQDALEENARMLENVLDDYGVKGEITSVRPGPVVTMYELEPAPGLKASRVIGLADDIARSMSALSARVSTVPGRSVIGIELPNAHREKVVLREILSARDYGDSQMRLPLALGKGIGGEPVVANLAKMPHLLIAGTTGSGKSVAINTMILSLLYRLTPDECRLIMIDPKMLELSVYDGIPHLLSPVVTDPKKAVVALKWVVAEMEDRYRKLSQMGVRHLDGYYGRVREAQAKGEMFTRVVQTGFDDATGEPVFEHEEFAPEAIPYIVVIVDEMADLMMVAGKEIEACIQRLAQMARASGIHLIMATQRPSVDVITGTIKANFPTRISFQVTSKIDSRTILGEMGAEQLLGMGDMLYMAGGGRITRIHGPFVSDEEVEEVVNHLKAFGPPDYVSGVQDGPEDGREADIDAVLGLGGGDGGDAALYDQAVAIVARDRKCSTSYIQRKLGIGYNKAARLVEQMEDQGVVTPANHVGKREILVPEM